jgi:hypothetical protein
MSQQAPTIQCRRLFGRVEIVALTLSLLAMLSCETPPKAAPGHDAPVVEHEVQREAEPLNDLAALAQRDVEAFLQSRRSSDNEIDRERMQQPEIIWNPVGRRIVDVSTPNAGGAPLEVIESPLARSSDPLAPVENVPAPADESGQAMGLDVDRLRVLIVDLSKELYQEASYADMPLRELLLIAATTLVSPDRALNPEAIPGLTVRERELLAHFQQFFVELGKSLDGSRNADEVLLNSVESLRESLRTEPRLALGSLSLCTEVSGFGKYTSFSRNSFLAHSDQQAVVYIEIAGFLSEQNPKGEWVTEVSQQLVIYSERDGIPVWREDWQTAVDVSRNLRNDFFITQLITLPKALSVGKYYLKVRVRDEKSRAEAEGSIPFEMVADPRLATGR